MERKYSESYGEHSFLRHIQPKSQSRMESHSKLYAVYSTTPVMRTWRVYQMLVVWIFCKL